MTPLEALAAVFSREAGVTVAASQAREAVAQVDPDDDLYRAIGADVRDLTGSVLRRAQDISVDLYRKNPLANRIIKIYTTYMAGTGFTLSCDHPEVQAIADEFWDAERNQMPINHRRFARDFLLMGEGPHPVAPDETGNTTVGYIDPRLIDRVTTNPKNRLIIEAITLSRGTGETEPLQVVRRQTSPFEEDAGLRTGDVFFWLHDRIGSGTRGTPFLLPAIDWLDAYDQVLWELLERTKAVRAFFWDVEVEGGDTEIKKAEKEWGKTAPRSGSVRFRTKGLNVQAQQPTLGAIEDVGTARFILRHIGTAAGLPPHWLGEPEDANRSTAEQMDKPTLRALEDIQAVWKSNVEDLVKFSVDRKVAAGLLPRIVERHDESGQPTGDRVPAADTVEVVTPAITDDEIESAAGALAAVAGAFVQLDMIGAVDQETARNIIRHMLPALGVPADELPDPEEASPEQMASAMESLYRRALRNGSPSRLEELGVSD